MATPDQIPSDLALEIGVDLTPEGFLAAARHFFGFVEEVTAELSERPVGWTVKVREGSNVIAMEPDELTAKKQLKAIYQKFRVGSRALMAGDLDGAQLGDRALAHAKALSQLTASKKQSITMRFWIEKKPVDVGPKIAEVIQEDWRADYNDVGTVEGRLQAIRESGNTLKISVKDLLFPRPIECIIPEKMVEEALSKFRKRVEVTGLIHYRKNGTPISIEVYSIEVLPDDDDLPSEKDVRGILS